MVFHRWRRLLLIPLVGPACACSSDLFHGTNWTPGCGEDDGCATSASSGGVGGGGTSSTATTSATSAGGTGGNGGGTGGAGGAACLNCAEALADGTDSSTVFCAMSHDLYVGLRDVCACDANNPDSCVGECAGSLCASAAITMSCQSCLATRCGATFTSCVTDTTH